MTETNLNFTPLKFCSLLKLVFDFHYYSSLNLCIDLEESILKVALPESSNYFFTLLTFYNTCNKQKRKAIQIRHSKLYFHSIEEKISRIQSLLISTPKKPNEITGLNPENEDSISSFNSSLSSDQDEDAMVTTILSEAVNQFKEDYVLNTPFLQVQQVLTETLAPINVEEELNMVNNELGLQSLIDYYNDVPSEEKIVAYSIYQRECNRCNISVKEIGEFKTAEEIDHEIAVLEAFHYNEDVPDVCPSAQPVFQPVAPTKQDLERQNYLAKTSEWSTWHTEDSLDSQRYLQLTHTEKCALGGDIYTPLHDVAVQEAKKFNKPIYEKLDRQRKSKAVKRNQSTSKPKRKYVKKQPVQAVDPLVGGKKSNRGPGEDPDEADRARRARQEQIRRDVAQRQNQPLSPRQQQQQQGIRDFANRSARLRVPTQDRRVLAVSTQPTNRLSGVSIPAPPPPPPIAPEVQLQYYMMSLSHAVREMRLALNVPVDQLVWINVHQLFNKVHAEFKRIEKEVKQKTGMDWKTFGRKFQAVEPDYRRIMKRFSELHSRLEKAQPPPLRPPRIVLPTEEPTIYEDEHGRKIGALAASRTRFLTEEFNRDILGHTVVMVPVPKVKHRTADELRRLDEQDRSLARLRRGKKKSHVRTNEAFKNTVLSNYPESVWSTSLQEIKNYYMQLGQSGFGYFEFVFDVAFPIDETPQEHWENITEPTRVADNVFAYVTSALNEPVTNWRIVFRTSAGNDLHYISTPWFRSVQRAYDDAYQKLFNWWKNYGQDGDYVKEIWIQARTQQSSHLTMEGEEITDTEYQGALGERQKRDQLNRDKKRRQEEQQQEDLEREEIRQRLRAEVDQDLLQQEEEERQKQQEAEDFERYALHGAASTRKMEKRFQALNETWLLVSPQSKVNCLWTAICMGKAAVEERFDLEKILVCKTVQNKMGSRLKNKLGSTFAHFGCSEDLQKAADHLKAKLVVYNFELTVLATFEPKEGDVVCEISLLLEYGHYYAMIPKRILGEGFLQYITQAQAEKPGRYRVKSKDFAEVLRRIVVYDIESYRKPLDPEEKVVEQIAYAIGWSLVVKDEEEEKHLVTKGYIMHPVTMNGKDYTFAYKHVLGVDCLEKALNEWLKEPVFHDACFYAHNGGKFDLRLIMGQTKLCSREKYEIDPTQTIELNGRFILMTIYNKKYYYDEEGSRRKVSKKESSKLSKEEMFHRISFKDSLPLFGVGNSLAELCKEFDVPHKKLEEQIDVHSLQYADTWEQNWNEHNLAKYLENDVFGLLEVLLKFEEECYGSTGLHITQVNTGASLAKKYFLKSLYDDEEKGTCIYELMPEEDTFLRASFNGGRVENFCSKKVEEKVYYYDFTSLYPDVARQDLPVGKPVWLISPEEETLLSPERIREVVNQKWHQRIELRQSHGMKMFWKVLVRSPLAAAGQPDLYRKPLIGLKNESTKGMFLFCWFSDWTEVTLYEEEILEAIDRKLDYEFRPVNAIQFNSAPVLTRAMNELFKKKADAKMEGKPALSKLWKIVINSLFGVWGLKKYGREGIEIAKAEFSMWCLALVQEKLVDVDQHGEYIVCRRLKDLEVHDCNVALASAITSEARLKLYRCIWDIQDHGGEILYCDTDSMITTCCIEEHQDLFDRWMGETRGEALGSLKNEVDECYQKLNKRIQKENEAKLKANPNMNRAELTPLVEPKPYFDQTVIVAPKLYLVSAEGGKIIKKAHKGYKEDSKHGDVVTYERLCKLVDSNLPPEERIMEQNTIQWVGGNGDILKGEIGVTLVQRHKVIRQVINKGTVTEDGTVLPFNNLPSKDAEKQKLDAEFDAILAQMTPEPL